MKSTNQTIEEAQKKMKEQDERMDRISKKVNENRHIFESYVDISNEDLLKHEDVLKKMFEDALADDLFDDEKSKDNVKDIFGLPKEEKDEDEPKSKPFSYPWLPIIIAVGVASILLMKLR